MSNSNITNKIRNLLRLAEGATNPNESAVAMAQAMRVAARAGIKLSDVNLATEDDAPVGDISVGAVKKLFLFSAQRLSGWKGILMDKISNAYNLRVLVEPGAGGRRYYFIGQERELSAAEYMYEFASRQIDRLFKDAKSNGGGRGKTFGTNFRLGAATQIGSNLPKMGDALTSAPEDVETDALVPVSTLEKYINDSVAALQSFIDNEGFEVTGSQWLPTSAEAFVAGAVAGATVNCEGHQRIEEKSQVTEDDEV